MAQKLKTKIIDTKKLSGFLVSYSKKSKARAGTITSGKEWFLPWKTIDGEKPRKGLTEIEVLLKGMCNKKRLLDIVRNFIVFGLDIRT